MPVSTRWTPSFPRELPRSVAQTTGRLASTTPAPTLSRYARSQLRTATSFMHATCRQACAPSSQRHWYAQNFLFLLAADAGLRRSPQTAQRLAGVSSAPSQHSRIGRAPAPGGGLLLHPQRRAARVEVQVPVGAVVDEAARTAAAGVAEGRVGGRRRRQEELEHEAAAAEEWVRRGGRREGAAHVEVEVAAAGAPVPAPPPVAGLLAAVAPERRAVGGHQLQLVRGVGVAGYLRWGLIVHLHDRWIRLA